MHFVMPRRDYAGFIFDCDGTLVDSMPLHHRAWQHAFAAHDARFEFGWDLFMSRAGMGLEQTVLELNRQFDHALVPELVVGAQRQQYLAIIDELQPIHEIVRLARELAPLFPLSVASGGEKPVVLRSLEAIGARDLFRHIVCQEDVVRGKPDPEMFLKCADLMGVAASDCLVFEDGAMGIAAAKAAGMGWVAVDGTGRSSEGP
jgi:beta-phosphoglucomutase-like phosphatase (HAD superfamily)